MTHTPYADAFAAVANMLTRFEVRSGDVFSFADIYDHNDVGDLPLYDVLDWLVAADAVRKAHDYADWSHDTMRYQAGPNERALYRLADMFRPSRPARYYTKRHVASFAISLRHEYYHDALAPFRDTDHGSDLHFALARASESPDYGADAIGRCFQEAAERLDKVDPTPSGVKWSAYYLESAVEAVLDGDYPHMAYAQIPGY